MLDLLWLGLWAGIIGMVLTIKVKSTTAISRSATFLTPHSSDVLRQVTKVRIYVNSQKNKKHKTKVADG